MLKNLILIIVCLLFNLNIFAQNILYGTITETIDSLKERFLYINNPLVPKASKQLHNEYIIGKMQEILISPITIDIKFDSLKYLSVLKSDDKQFVIYTWQVIYDDIAKYYGFIQYVDKKTKKINLILLNDQAQNLSKEPDKMILNNENWMGAIYYNIIPFSPKHSKQTYYILLGINVNDKVTNKKIIETLSFSKNGKPMFGSDLFKITSSKQKRIIFEYSDMVTMSLKYDQKKKAIIFDHLSPSDASLKGKYMYYGPDFSYDAFALRKKNWIFMQDINPNNPKEFDIKHKRKAELQLTQPQ